MAGWRSRKWLFGAGPNSANSVRRELKAGCARAGVEWITPHRFGRHMSVTKMLRARYSVAHVAHVAQAHNMTREMVTRRYGHLTMAETTEALHKVGGELVGEVLNGGIVGEGRVGGEISKRLSALSHRNIFGKRVLPAAFSSEGDALSSYATGASEKPSKHDTSIEVEPTPQDGTGRQQTPHNGGNVGETSSP